MALRSMKPTSPALRKMTYPDFAEITKNKPQKSLTRPLNKHSGRDRTGKISIRHRGGGHKRLYRLVDFKQTAKLNMPATVLAIEYDPNRSGRIALIQYEDSTKSYILAPQELKPGEKIVTAENGDPKIGNRLKIKNIPTGVPIYNIELTPGRGGQMVRSAGQAATILAKEGRYAHVRLPSAEVRLVLLECYASIGTVSNPDHSSVRIGKAGRRRHMGWRPSVRGKAMNPNDHPHGGGEGQSPIGMKHPKTPWGKPALGYRTRRNKRTTRFIIKRRK